MLLNERKIKKHIGKQQIKQNSIKEVDFRYNRNKNDVLMDTKGMGNIIHEEEFYDNLYEDVLSVDSFCITRLAKRFNSNMKISTTILPDGCMDFNSVNVNLNLSVPNKKDVFNETSEHVKIRGYLYSQYKKLVPFYQYIKTIEFIYQNYRLCNISVEIELDLEKANPLFETKFYNNQILEQWLATYETISEQSADEHSIYFKLPIIKGQMRFDMREECMRARYEYEIDR